MAKETKTVPEEMHLANPKGKTVEELKEIAQNLQMQVNKSRGTAMKAQGALEVILQMIPKEEVEKMIRKEGRTNGEAVNDTETTD